jgi:hypothetical protein
VAAGIPERVAMTMTGHKTRSVSERYSIVSDRTLLIAARRLDSFNGHSREAMGTMPGTVGTQPEPTETVSLLESTVRP